MAKAKYKAASDGKFRTKVWDGSYNADGTKHRINLVSDKSSRDLELKVAEHNQALREGKYVAHNNVTLAKYAGEWLICSKGTKERSTRASYKIYVDAYFKTWNIPLSNLTKSFIQKKINEKADFPRTCEMLRLIWKQIIRAAIDDGLLPETAERRLCNKISVPKRGKSQRRPLTDREKSYIQAADFNAMERLYVFLLFSTGMRKGEALALSVHKISYEKKTITIDAAVGYDENTPYLKMPKSMRGFREIPFPDYLVPILKAAIPNAQGRFFYGAKSAAALMSQSSYTKFFAAIKKKIEHAAHSMPDATSEDLRYTCSLTAHFFRHNYCTSLCYQIPKISIKKIASLLGDSEDMVIDVYSHIMEEQENVEDALAAAVGL